MAELIRWQDIAPKDAVSLNLAERLDITAPLNENGERCPWPWEPQQLKGAPIGQYRCGYCYAMCVAGMEHFDYTGDTFADGGPGKDDRTCCQEPTCPNFGDPDFGEATCPAGHADPRPTGSGSYSSGDES